MTVNPLISIDNMGLIPGVDCLFRANVFNREEVFETYISLNCCVRWVCIWMFVCRALCV